MGSHGHQLRATQAATSMRLSCSTTSSSFRSPASTLTTSRPWWSSPTGGAPSLLGNHLDKPSTCTPAIQWPSSVSWAVASTGASPPSPLTGPCSACPPMALLISRREWRPNCPLLHFPSWRIFLDKLNWSQGRYKPPGRLLEFWNVWHSSVIRSFSVFHIQMHG